MEGEGTMKCATCDGTGSHPGNPFMESQIVGGWDLLLPVHYPCPDCLGEKVAQVDELYLEVKK